MKTSDKKIAEKKISERLRSRLMHNRTMTTISVRMPEDVIDDLKRLAPMLGFSGYQPLMRAYIGQGLRKDLVRFNNDPLQILAESLRKHGVKEDIISQAIAEARPRSA